MQAVPESRYGNDDADATDWFERWGRTAANWLAVLVAVLLLAGGSVWLHDENKLDTTLKVLAKAPLPARQATPAPAPASTAAMAVATPATAPAIADEPQPAAPGPAKALPATAAPVQSDATDYALAATTETPAPLVQAKPHAATLAPAPTEKKAARAQEKNGDAKPARAGKLAETLRQCRQAGYPAARCAQLGCKATKYGLVCKGSRSGN